ncbi:ABC transporter ATP-binding protein [Mycolicibacterium confluentis]|uniref:Putative oligopeptide ABC transporter, ATP-binding protein n=1 Tax=Mycolicibacterium confluentis TaxID=28047 RepID=A0A7I7XR82_9MYCO|nr:ABC transporter ATP-binding protein [Mycolicibacterium confluentis]MCV7322557.1 ABC transporter ATP-binding protein [Mycolicibacterium confluentis]ORV21405.1 glutathione ABC transporter ATP-binding protein [Mycolicibacterium confluentis]BBZ31700.1 putative oligopeptide ABC transporter, ATP-binding protein [Mycolicibacterium confluentis]
MTETTQSAPALSFQRLSVSFATDAGSVRAVDEVSFDVQPGEVLAVVGESGSGKSVSSRAAIGLLPDTARVSGTVLLGDRDVATLSDKQFTALRGKDIAMVFQEPGAALDPLFTVGYQVSEAVRAHSDMNRREARERAIELLRLVRLPDPEHRYDYYPHQLSGGQKQRVVIATAIACDPAVIIADEPTTALDVTVQAEILELLRDLRDRMGSAIVLITHNMGVVADLADRVVVMNAGRVVEIASVEKLFDEPEADYTRTLLDAVPHLGQGHTGKAATDEDAPVVLEVSGLTVQFPGPIGGAPFKAVDNVSLTVARGRTLGLVGESGSGKSTIGRCVAALQKPTSGTVTILGQEITGLSQRALRPVRGRFGFVFQDPATSLNPRLRVGDCVAEPLLVHKVAKGEKLRTRVTELLDAVRLPKDTAERYPHELSGGQRQRANLARALALGPDLLVADEPTSALDVSVQASVLDLFEELQREWQFACLFISHDLAVVDRLADEIAVLRDGVLQEVGTPDAILRNPQTEYTRRLVAAVPVPDPAEQRRRREASAGLFD